MLTKWENWTKTPLIVAGLLFLVVYSIPIINPDVSESVKLACTRTSDVIWVLYVIDLIVCLVLAEQKISWMKKNVLNLFAVALPIIRPLRAFRALSMLTFLVRNQVAQSKRSNYLISVITAAFGTWLVAGLAVTECERNFPGTHIHDVADGWLWSLTTLTTIGYSDLFPVTFEGKIIGVAVMLVGLALLGTATAWLASHLMSLLADEQEDTQAAINEERLILEQILNELRVRNQNEFNQKEFNQKVG